MIETLKSKWYLLPLVVTVFLLGATLNPFDGSTFSGHDETQAARIVEFTHNLTSGQIPPRIAPNMSFGLGYPIFNYYAPTAYWITSLIHILGFNVSQALEISYFFALLAAASGFYLFSRKYFHRYAATTAAVLYISSPVVAVDIFVRSNLAEIWFYALFPWALALLQRATRKRFFITAFVITALFSVHTIFSLVSIPLLFAFSWINKSKIQAVSILLGLIMASSFLVPALGELGGVQASNIATITQYQDHFICPFQLWYSSWGYGGSTDGCTDGMSFMLGKIHILTGLAGLGLLLMNLLKDRHMKNALLLLSLVVVLFGSVFMSISASSFVWKLFEPVLSIFQFPWRFLLFVIFGLSFFGGYALNTFPKRLSLVTAVVVMVSIFYLSPKFFKGQTISQQEFLSTYASQEYIRNIAAYRVAEYLPETVNYESWRQLEKDDIKPKSQAIGFNRFEMEVAQNTIIPIHYAPYWDIKINGESFVPDTFDNLGRPRIKVGSEPVKVTVSYKQTPLQQLANIISLLTGILVLIYSQSHKWQIKKT